MGAGSGSEFRRPGHSRGLAASAIVLVAGALVPPPAASAAPAPWSAPRPADVTGVRVADHRPQSLIRPAPTPAGVTGARPVAWPAPGTTTTAVSATARSGVSPVRVRPIATDDAAGRRPIGPPTAVSVTVHDRATTERAGVGGVVMELSRADGRDGPGAVDVELSYAGFAHAYGGDWSSRLRLVERPACVLTTPHRPECQTSEPLPTANDGRAATLTAKVQVSGAATVLAAEAGSASEKGDYTATDLNQAGTWDVSYQTGDFSWSYPMRMPPALGGPAPIVSVGYSSGSVDGRTGATNNQGGWIGDGWASWPGYIERRYASCADDNPGHKTGDQCWFNDNATLSMNGRAGELIKSGGVYRLKNDDGTRVERLASSARDNGDDDNEYWKVTTVDGTQYFFGYHKLPGWVANKPVTNSTWTTPVFGNNTQDPCYDAAFADAYCSQAWRWNLDYVVDPNGNTMAYFYGKETGAYARDNTPSQRTTYDRGGYLTRIEYGLRANAEYTEAAPLRVLFETKERCLATCWSGTAWTSDPVESAWPDTPWDQFCDDAPCNEQGSPTFWSARRLTKITTEVRSGTSTYTPVESWSLRHEFVNAGTGEGTPMWLAGITHTGHVTRAGGTAVSDPEITFDRGSDPLPNRVDAVGDNRSALNRWRVKAVHTESGGDIVVTYSTPDCVAGATPTPHTNTKRCMPVRWDPPEESGDTVVTDWFHKYVVKQIDLDDTVADQLNTTTFYDYLDNPAWHYTDDEITKDKYKTWGDWRGYGRVQVREGTSSGAQTAVEYRYLRGMDGDKLPDDGNPNTVDARDVHVTGLWGGAIEDHEALRGFLLHEIVLNGAGGAEVSSTRNDPWTSGPTATRTRNGVTTNAWKVNTGETRERVALTSGYRTTRSTTQFNSDGLVTDVTDHGDIDVTGDETCSRRTYARNDGIWMIDRVKSQELLSVACAAAATPAAPATVLSQTRTFYDVGSPHGQAPTRGNVVREEELDRYTGSTPVYVPVTRNVVDANGRVTLSTDARDYATETTRTTAHGGLVTKTVVENALGHEVTTFKEPAWDQPTQAIDANGVVTDLTYDGLGRLTQVWLPGRPKASFGTSPSIKYAYLLRNAGGPTAVTTETLLPTGTAYKKSVNLYDGFLRLRQNQTQATGGGRLLADTFHNTRGGVDWTSQPYYDASNAPVSTTLGTPVGQIPAVTQSLYDGAGRETTKIFKKLGAEDWRTTTVYAGDRVHVTPPEGGTATTEIHDARGQTVELRQYKSFANVGSADPATFVKTTYTHSLDEKLTGVRDQVGNVWSYTFDRRGRQVGIVDPDKGTSTSTYDAVGNLLTVTEPLGSSTATTTAYTYDALGRKTTVRDDTVTGTKRAEWVYDTLPGGKGKQTSATRYANGNAYTSRTDTFDAYGRPTSLSVVLPPAEANLCAAAAPDTCVYTTTTTYRADGSVFRSALPAAANLPSETLTYGYSDIGQPAGLLSPSQIYVYGVTYDKLGQLTGRELGAFGSRVAVTSTFDEPTRRLSELNVVPEGKPEAAAYHYRYDDIGNVTELEDAPTGQPADRQCYRTDHLRRLTEAWTTTAGACGAVPTAWSAVGGPAPYWQSFTYDVTGNRVREVRHSSTDTTYSYGYPAAATPRPHAVTSVIATGGASWTRNYSYDNGGNTKTRVDSAGATQTLTYDREGYVESLVQGGVTHRYIHDAEGERLISVDGTGRTLYLPGGIEVRYTTSGGTKTATRYYTHAGEVVAVRTGAGLSWLVNDHHGTAELAINATTLAVAKRRTLPFGDPRGTGTGTWPVGMDKGFVGGTKDPTGLTHLGARMYDAFLGRFVSVDPMVDTNDPQTLHGYAYGNNAPPSYEDPSGLCWICNAAKGVAKATGVDKAISAAATEFRQSTVGRIGAAAIDRAANNLKAAGDAIGDGLTAAGKWAWDNRGMLVTIAATATCFTPAIGLAVCAGLQAVAYGVRTAQRITDEGGWEKNKRAIAVDGLLTVGTLGVGGAFRMAQFGTTRAIKGVKVEKTIPRTNIKFNWKSYEHAWTPGYRSTQEIGTGFSRWLWSKAPVAARGIAWTGPAFATNQCYNQNGCGAISRQLRPADHRPARRSSATSVTHPRVGGFFP